MTRPDFLYRYQPCSEIALSNLRRGILYFSPANAFNDPFDCRFSFLDAGLSAEDLAQLKRELPIDDNLDNEQLSAAIIRYSAETLSRYFYDRGVCCFSAVHDNLLMWAHYAQGHRGFCLKFDTTNEVFSRVSPVSYSRDYPSFSPADCLIRNEYCKVFDVALRTKSDSWSYEQEWRIVHERAGQECFFAKEALVGIYLGLAVDARHADEISTVAAALEVPVFQAHRSLRSYALDFEILKD